MARKVAADYQDKADQILAAAGRVFAEKGYERATMADIARAAGFGKASAYHYYQSKEAVLHALLQQSLRFLIDAVTAADPGPSTPPSARLARLLEGYIQAFISRVFVLTPLLLDLGQLRPEWRGTVKSLERQLLDRFAEAAAAAGTPLPPHVTALLMFGAANWTYYWFDPDGTLSSVDLARGAAALLSGGPPAPNSGGA